MRKGSSFFFLNLDFSPLSKTSEVCDVRASRVISGDAAMHSMNGTKTQNTLEGTRTKRAGRRRRVAKTKSIRGLGEI